MNRIAELRSRENLTQKDFAKKINMNYSVISRIETGERPIRDDELINIANFFNVTTDYLLGRSHDPRLTKKEERDLQRELDSWIKELDQGTLQMKLDGNEIDEEVKQFIIDSMEDTLTLARIKAKEKFTPNRYKKKK